uniref:Uncharacterized protein n=1 Tax=Panagrolaimus davidi TaxID=227884 RepID=A0A914P572_9BILA
MGMFENKLCHFPNNRLEKLLLNSSGNRVNTLFIEEYVPEYQSVFDRIAEKRQLASIYVSNKFCSNPSYMIDYLPILSSSLKNMTIPNCLMNEKFRDCFKLKSLTVTELNNSFLTKLRYLKFCCKTDLLEFSSDFRICQLFSDLDDIKSSQCSPHLSSVKQLTFNGCIYSQCIKFFIDGIKKATKVPPKINVTFLEVGFLNFDDCKLICKDFDVNEPNTAFYCFKKTIKSAGSESTILEIQIAR